MTALARRRILSASAAVFDLCLFRVQNRNGSKGLRCGKQDQQRRSENSGLHIVLIKKLTKVNVRMLDENATQEVIRLLNSFLNIGDEGHCRSRCH